MNAVGYPMHLFLLLFGSALTTRVFDPQPATINAPDTELFDLRHEFDDMIEKFTHLKQKFFDFKKKKSRKKVVGRGLKLALGTSSPQPSRSQEADQGIKLKSRGGSIDGRIAPTSAPTLDKSHSGGLGEQSSLRLPSSGATSTAHGGEEYRFWREDTQIGTEEIDKARTKRGDLPTNGFRERLFNILSDVSASGVPPDTKAFAWYDTINDKSKSFVIKFTMEPTVYNYIYMQYYKALIPPEEYPKLFQGRSFESNKMRFEADYYGDRLLQVYQANQSGKAARAGHRGSRMLRANDELVMGVGAILLFDTPKPLLLSDLTDDLMESVEAAVLDAFKDQKYVPEEPFWHSICLLPLPVEGTRINVNQTRFLIGSKIDEVTFFMALPNKVQKIFLPKKGHRDKNLSNASRRDNRREGQRTTVVKRSSKPEVVEVTVTPFELAIASFHKDLDASARVHGSYACGLADEHSDVDLLTNFALHKLLEVVDQGQTAFQLVEHIVATRVPRLVLRHQSTGVLVDVIESREDPWATGKDNFIRTWMARRPAVRDFAVRLRQWAKDNQQLMPRHLGYPHKYILLLSGIWYLCAYEGFRCCLGEASPPSLPSISFAKSEADLAQRYYSGWLRWMAGSSMAPRMLDLRDLERQPSDGSPWWWSLVEPESGQVVCNLRLPQAHHLAALAAASCKGTRCFEANVIPQAGKQPCDSGGIS